MGKKLEKPAPPPKLEVPGRATSLASKCLRFLTKNRSKHEVNPQLNSPLFTQLPQELRDKIWQFVLEPPKDASSAHFHIYDEVYDACTYDKPDGLTSHTRANSRRSKQHIALLMSCRRIHHEALDYLYDESKFTFVVFAGRPRIYCKPKHDDSRKSLGKLQECEELFRRIRNLTIIIQPGKNPHVDLYTKRLQQLLKALSYGEHLHDLTLIFNWRLEIFAHDPDQLLRAGIVKSLYPLQTQLAPRVAARKCKLTIFAWSAEQSTEDLIVGGVGKYTQLLRFIGGVTTSTSTLGSSTSTSISTGTSQCKLVGFNPASKDDKKKLVKYGAELCCLERGAFGEDFYALKQLQPMTRTPLNMPFGLNVSREEMECAVFLAGYLLLLPLTAPITASIFVKRKRAKGEWR